MKNQEKYVKSQEYGETSENQESPAEIRRLGKSAGEHHHFGIITFEIGSVIPEVSPYKQRNIPLYNIGIDDIRYNLCLIPDEHHLFGKITFEIGLVVLDISLYKQTNFPSL